MVVAFDLDLVCSVEMPRLRTLTSFVSTPTHVLAFMSLLLVMSGCTPAAAPSAPSQAAPVSAISAPSAAPAASTGAAPVASATAGPARSVCAETTPSNAASEATEARAFARLLEAPIESASVGKAGRAVFLSGTRVHLFDDKQVRALEPAIHSTAEGLHAQVFFGRDNAPRVMGFVEPAGPGELAKPVYLRYRDGRLREAKDEIGRLGTARGALYGELGHDDPEVVCLAGATCIVKRITGWKDVPAHAAPVSMVLTGGEVFAWHAAGLEQLTKAGFASIDSTSTAVRSVWLSTDQTLWVVDQGSDSLRQRRVGVWTTLPSPLPAPTFVWGRTASDVWLASAEGVAHFDGQSWRCVRGVTGPISWIMGDAESVWLGGPAGAYRSEVRLK